MQKAKAAEHAMSSEVRRIRRVVREKSFVFQLRDRFKYPTRWETTTGHVRKICQDEASLWVSRSEWMSREREYQNAPSLDFWDFYLMRLLSKSCTVIEKLCFPSMLWNNPHWWILRSFKSSQKMLSNAASPGLCSRMGSCKFISGICFRSRRTFRRLCLPSPIWTAFMFQTFCESYHIEMLFCQMHRTWTALQFTIQYNTRIYTYYIFTYNYTDASTTYVLYIHSGITIIQLYGSILIHRFYKILVTAFHSNFDCRVRPRVRTCAVQLAGHLYGAHGKAHRICISKKKH